MTKQIWPVRYAYFPLIFALSNIFSMSHPFLTSFCDVGININFVIFKLKKGRACRSAPPLPSIFCQTNQNFRTVSSTLSALLVLVFPNFCWTGLNGTSMLVCCNTLNPLIIYKTLRWNKSVSLTKHSTSIPMVEFKFKT